MDANDLANKLNEGWYTIPFSDVYAEASRVENDISGFTAEED